MKSDDVSVLHLAVAGKEVRLTGQTSMYNTHCKHQTPFALFFSLTILHYITSHYITFPIVRRRLHRSYIVFCTVSGFLWYTQVLHCMGVWQISSLANDCQFAAAGRLSRNSYLRLKQSILQICQEANELLDVQAYRYREARFWQAELSSLSSIPPRLGIPHAPGRSSCILKSHSYLSLSIIKCAYHNFPVHLKLE